MRRRSRALLHEDRLLPLDKVVADDDHLDVAAEVLAGEEGDRLHGLVQPHVIHPGRGVKGGGAGGAGNGTGGAGGRPGADSRKGSLGVLHAHPVPVHHDLLRLPALVLIVYQQVVGHVLHVMDHLLVLGAVLYPQLDLVVGGLGLDAANDGGDAWLVGPHHHHRPLQQRRLRYPQLGVDLEADVADGLLVQLLGRRLKHVVFEEALRPGPCPRPRACRSPPPARRKAPSAEPSSDLSGSAIRGNYLKMQSF